MLFSYNWLKEYAPDLPKPSYLATDIAMHAFEVEEVRKTGKDWMFSIDVLPPRADCLSHYGMAREISVITKGKLGAFGRRPLKVAKGELAPLKVEIQTELVPRYAAFVLEGVQIQPSPKWVQERLASLGVNSINNVVDVTNLVMLELGQPLHAFDYNKIQGNAFTIRGARKGEKIVALDKRELSLPEGALVIEDGERLIDLAGIKGGSASAISENTRSIVLQAAVFDARHIYATRKALNYRTPAADLYAHGVDWNLPKPGLERALFLLEELKAGGKLTQIIDIYPKAQSQVSILFYCERARAFLGLEVKDQEMIQTLRSLGCVIEKRKQGIAVQPPSWRGDLIIEEDLIEEVGRLHGYHKIPAQLPVGALSVPPPNDLLFWQHRAQDTLKEAGFTELYTYSFIGEKDTELLQYGEAERKSLVLLENPLSEDAKYLRPTLMDSQLRPLVFNVRLHPDKSIRTFEIGKVFSAQKGIPQEHLMAAALYAPASCSSADAFAELKGVLDLLFSRMGITDAWYDNYQQSPEVGRPSLWHPRRSAEIKIGEKEIGFLGELAPRVKAAFKLERPVLAFELRFAELAEMASQETEYRPIRRHPATLRDISLLVPQETRVADIMNRMHEASPRLISDIDLIDLYEGAPIPAGQKSLTFRIVYQSDERTLTSEEVDKIHEDISKVLEEVADWEIRA